MADEDFDPYGPSSGKVLKVVKDVVMKPVIGSAPTKARLLSPSAVPNKKQIAYKVSATTVKSRVTKESLTAKVATTPKSGPVTRKVRAKVLTEVKESFMDRLERKAVEKYNLKEAKKEIVRVEKDELNVRR
jgi:hypothetical protein